MPDGLFYGDMLAHGFLGMFSSSLNQTCNPDLLVHLKESDAD